MYHPPPPPSLSDFSHLCFPSKVTQTFIPQVFYALFMSGCEGYSCLFTVIIEKHRGIQGILCFSSLHPLHGSYPSSSWQSGLIAITNRMILFFGNIRKPLVLQWRVHWNHCVLPDGKIYSSRCSLFPCPHPKLGNSMRNTNFTVGHQRWWWKRVNLFLPFGFSYFPYWEQTAIG